MTRVNSKKVHKSLTQSTNKIKVLKNINPYLFGNKIVINNLDLVLLNYKNLKYPIYKGVLLLTNNELSRLIFQLDKFDGGGNSPDEQRKLVQNAYLEVLKTYLGSETVKQWNKKTLSSINELITGLPSKGAIFNQYKYEDLFDSKTVTDSEIDKIVVMLMQGKENLENVSNDLQNKYRLVSYENTFYWVPQELLP